MTVVLAVNSNERITMIYGRFGNKVEIVRVGTLDDVRKLDKRKPDRQDRDAIEVGSYVVTRSLDSEDKSDKLRLHHVAYLKADGGWKEIHARIEELDSTARPGTGAVASLLKF